MPRRARIAPGGIVYHALNRGNGRNEPLSQFGWVLSLRADYGGGDAPLSRPPPGVLFEKIRVP